MLPGHANPLYTFCCRLPVLSSTRVNELTFADRGAVLTDTIPHKKTRQADAMFIRTPEAPPTELIPPPPYFPPYLSIFI